jgi:hypothetical protein
MTAYADTSFLVSLYLPDVHSPVAWAAMKSRPHLYLTPLHELELVNAVQLAVFRKLIRRTEAKAVLRNFELDRGGLFALTPIPVNSGRVLRPCRATRSTPHLFSWDSFPRHHAGGNRTGAEA